MQHRRAAGRFVLFVHGGAFLRGNMNSNEQIYGNVLYYFARQGMLGINIEYRLAPEAAYPAGSQDVAAAVAWVRQHAAEYGGDPQRIILIGHSAGGAHAASYVADPQVRPVAGHGIAALVLISARLRADVHADNPNAGGVKAYWGEDVSRYEQVSPVTYAAQIDVPLMIAVPNTRTRISMCTPPNCFTKSVGRAVRRHVLSRYAITTIRPSSPISIPGKTCWAGRFSTLSKPVASAFIN